MDLYNSFTNQNEAEFVGISFLKQHEFTPEGLPPRWMKVSKSPWVRSLLPAGQSLVMHLGTGPHGTPCSSHVVWELSGKQGTFQFTSNLWMFCNKEELNLQSIFFARFTFIRWRVPPSTKPSSQSVWAINGSDFREKIPVKDTQNGIFKAWRYCKSRVYKQNHFLKNDL